MSVGTPPIKSNLPVSQETAAWPQTWANWFTSVWQAIFGWSKTYTGTLTHDFGSISTLSQAIQTVTITGARSGDAVIVRPTTAVNGLFVDGTVTANDVVTVRIVNYSSGSIDPASQIYRIIVFQQ